MIALSLVDVFLLLSSSHAFVEMLVMRMMLILMLTMGM